MTDQGPAKVHIPIGEADDRFIEVSRQLLRFGALANGGGAVAIITMLGATAKAGTILNVLAWPLGFFAAGLICALLLALAFAIMFRGLLTEWVPAYML